MTDKDFSNHPVSIAEIRAEKSRAAKDWTPRDALVDMLRQIDNGLVVPDMVICYVFIDEDNDRCISYANAGPAKSVETVGILETIKMITLEGLKQA